jgi:solute carrier family 25 phosphate transporter 23/24/25/41
MLGILPYAGVDIAAFEIAKENLVEAYQGAPLPGTSLLAAGLMSSTIAQVIAYPLGFVRTRLQVSLGARQT